MSAQKAKKKEPNDVASQLEKSAKIFRERGVVYGEAYKQHGSVMETLFPDGIELSSAHDMNRFAILSTIVAKIERYSHNFFSGGHEDSMTDISVYASMLNEIDSEGL